MVLSSFLLLLSAVDEESDHNFFTKGHSAVGEEVEEENFATSE